MGFRASLRMCLPVECGRKRRGLPLALGRTTRRKHARLEQPAGVGRCACRSRALAIAAHRDRLVVARVIRAEDGFGATACDLVKKRLKSRDGPKTGIRTRCPRTRNESRGLFAFRKDPGERWPN